MGTLIFLFVASVVFCAFVVYLVILSTKLQHCKDELERLNEDARALKARAEGLTMLLQIMRNDLPQDLIARVNGQIEQVKENLAEAHTNEERVEAQNSLRGWMSTLKLLSKRM